MSKKRAELTGCRIFAEDKCRTANEKIVGWTDLGILCKSMRKYQGLLFGWAAAAVDGVQALKARTSVAHPYAVPPPQQVEEAVRKP